MDRRIALTAIVCIGWTALTFVAAMVRGAGAAGEAAGAVNAAILPAAAAGVGGVALLALWLCSTFSAPRTRPAGSMRMRCCRRVTRGFPRIWNGSRPTSNECSPITPPSRMLQYRS